MKLFKGTPLEMGVTRKVFFQYHFLIWRIEMVENFHRFLNWTTGGCSI